MSIKTPVVFLRWHCDECTGAPQFAIVQLPSGTEAYFDSHDHELNAPLPLHEAVEN